MLRRVVYGVLQQKLFQRPSLTVSAIDSLVKQFQFQFKIKNHIHMCATLQMKDRESKFSHSVKQVEGVDAERASKDVMLKLEGMFSAGFQHPTIETHKMTIDGKRYDELPVVHIKATRNNTHVALANYEGDVLTLSSCGCEGFKNAKKGTNIAAQATGMTVGQRSKNMDIKYVRVSVKGLGPGRLAAIKGLQLAGLEVVSISDVTPVLFGGPRPRKRRRL